MNSSFRYPNQCRRLREASLVLVFVSSVIPEGAAPHWVYEDQDDKDAGVADSQCPPLRLYVGKKTCPAWFAVKAQLLLVVAPCLAVGVCHRRPRLWHHPERRILELKTTVGWRLAATRLRQKKKNGRLKDR